MKKASGSRPQKAKHRPITPVDARVWIISADKPLCDRVIRLIAGVVEPVIVIAPGRFPGDDVLSECRRGGPRLVVLDVDRAFDWGREVIRCIKRVDPKAQILVLTDAFSREFGTKIVSEGVRYCFGRDFSEDEFREVTRSLFKPRVDPSAGGGR